ncbi:hypothetical protein [Christiangramia sediminis]|uniref:Uncharacterized protein n=1 Tax=Christiangramia sediminis TaxID=2881336 RepID=A0A9X1LJN5_9FLAO|nr:hypothetical protein [Christiangramia sediminis]MCB7481613.1 hypothetical protein [Christiangramia sediminis]
MKIFLNVLFIAFGLIAVGSISMLGIELNDTRESVENLNLPVVGEEPGMIKYRTKNGNDFSVTFKNERVVYMENDWLLEEEGKEPLFTEFTFGKTSIADIRNEFGSNGFTYSNRLFSSTGTHLVTFNCFEFDTAKNEILVTVTGISIAEKDEVNESNISDKLKLLAIIIGDKDYLDKIWGEEKTFDDTYRKIQI